MMKTIFKIIETPRGNQYLVANLGTFIVPDNKNIRIAQFLRSIPLTEAWKVAHTIPKREEYQRQNSLLFHLSIESGQKRINSSKISKIISENSYDLLWWDRHLGSRISNVITHFKVLWEVPLESTINLSNLYKSRMIDTDPGLGISMNRMSLIRNWIRKYWTLQNYEITI